MYWQNKKDKLQAGYMLIVSTIFIYHLIPEKICFGGDRCPIKFQRALFLLGQAVAPLRHCATSRKVEGSIPDGVIGIFHWHKPSTWTMAVGSTQPLTEMSTRNISCGVKAVG